MISTGEVSFSPATSSGNFGGEDGCKVTLEQKPFKKLSVSFADVQLMIDAALSGHSAHSITDTDCPVQLKEFDGDAEVALVFYVLKTLEDIDVTLEASGGELIIVGDTLISKEKSVIFGLESKVSFDFRVQSILSTNWESKIVGTDGSVLAINPPITIIGTRIYVPEVIFGVARMVMEVPVTQCVLILTIPKSDGYKVSKITASVTARWMCEDKQESTALTLEIPQCVYDQLSTCPNGTLKNKGGMSVKNSFYKSMIQVYYNTCDGDVLGTKQVTNSKPTDYTKW